jgi:hypothetical protein
MRIHVVYDGDGNIIATAEIASGPDEPSLTPLPSPGQAAAEFDVPGDYEEMTPLERHNSLKVDVQSSSPALVRRATSEG